MVAQKERTFIMIKPDGVQRGLVGRILNRFEDKGFKLVALKMVWQSVKMFESHYIELSDQPFFSGLVKYMASGPVIAMVWEGINAVKTGRQILGADNIVGSIRGDFSMLAGHGNIIHGSDAIKAANREIALWFNDEELVAWKQPDNDWIYDLN